jgi:hypothetical protein
MTMRQEFLVIQSYGDFEVREYLPCVIAEVRVSANLSQFYFTAKLSEPPL